MEETKNVTVNINYEIKIGDKIIKTELNVKLLDVTVDNKLNFGFHSKQHMQNCVIPIKCFMSPKTYRVLYLLSLIINSQPSVVFNHYYYLRTIFLDWH